MGFGRSILCSKFLSTASTFGSQNLSSNIIPAVAVVRDFSIRQTLALLIQNMVFSLDFEGLFDLNGCSAV